MTSVFLTELLYDQFFAEPGARFQHLSRDLAALWTLPLGMLLMWLLDFYLNPRMKLEIVPPSIGRSLTEAEMDQMAQYGVTYNEEYFTVGDMDFDRLPEALQFARATRRQQREA